MLICKKLPASLLPPKIFALGQERFWPLLALREFEKFDSEIQAKKNVVAAIESVAQRLGNTPTICRQCYVHPAILDSYLDGSMIESLQQSAQEEWEGRAAKSLQPEEAAVMALLQRRLASESAK